jgi:hypothetical protein
VLIAVDTILPILAALLYALLYSRERRATLVG